MEAPTARLGVMSKTPTNHLAKTPKDVLCHQSTRFNESVVCLSLCTDGMLFPCHMWQGCTGVDYMSDNENWVESKT